MQLQADGQIMHGLDQQLVMHECEIDAGCIQYYLLALLAGTIILASRVGIVPNFHVFCTLPCALFRHLMVVSRLDNRQSLIWQS